jgi:hypothetical protein
MPLLRSASERRDKKRAALEYELSSPWRKKMWSIVAFTTNRYHTVEFVGKYFTHSCS